MKKYALAVGLFFLTSLLGFNLSVTEAIENKPIPRKPLVPADKRVKLKYQIKPQVPPSRDQRSPDPKKPDPPREIDTPENIHDDTLKIAPEIDIDDYLIPIYKNKFEEGINEDADYVSDQILVILDGTKPKKGKINNLESKYKLNEGGIYPLSTIDSTLIVFNVLEKQKIAPLIKRINSGSDIVLAQPNYLYKSLNKKTRQYGVHKIKADIAHETTTGKGVKVGLIDTGIDYDHHVLKNKVILKKNFVDSNSNSFKSDPHGTSIAGIIAASADSTGKIIGVSPDVRIIAAKACWSTKKNTSATCSTENLALATNYVVKNGSDVVNFSLGGPKDGIIRLLVRKGFSKGITFVGASGNGGKGGNAVYPAALDEVIAVSATDINDKLYKNSTRGNYIDLSAPGVEILSPAPENKWQILSGTSMAAAHVTGAVALLIQIYPELSPIQIKNFLSSSSLDLGKPGKDEKYGDGRINIVSALRKLETDTAKNLQY